MVILDADHPDIEEFIWCKAHEEEKARALRDAGFDMDLDGSDINSIQYQNANNSVRVSDEFMEAVVADGDWNLTARHGDAHHPHREGPRALAPDRAAPRGRAPTRVCSSTRPSTSGTRRPNTERINGSNPCSEYMHIDNSACNLASINLMKFLRRRRATSTSRRSSAAVEVALQRPGDHRRRGRLPDREDRRELAQVPPARPRLRQPRGAAHGLGSGVRLRRGSGLGGGDHGAA